MRSRPLYVSRSADGETRETIAEMRTRKAAEPTVRVRNKETGITWDVGESQAGALLGRFGGFEPTSGAGVTP